MFYGSTKCSLKITYGKQSNYFLIWTLIETTLIWAVFAQTMHMLNEMPYKTFDNLT